MTNRLYRSRHNRVLGGVCAGLGRYFGIDAIIVRVIFLVLAIWGGLGVLAYLILWVLMPPEEREPVAGQDIVESSDSGYDMRGGWHGEPSAPRERTIWAAVALIALGVVFLFETIFGIALINLWPLILIVIGGYLIFQAVRR